MYEAKLEARQPDSNGEPAADERVQNPPEGALSLSTQEAGVLSAAELIEALSLLGRWVVKRAGQACTASRSDTTLP